MFEIKMKLRHPCPYLELANIFDLNLYLYCSDFFDLLIIPKLISDEEMEIVKSKVKKPDTVEITVGGEDGNTTYIHFECMCDLEKSVSPNIQRLGGLLELPVLYKDGWEYYKIISLNKKSQAKIMEYIQTIPEYEILSITDLDIDQYKYQFLTTNEIMKNLTARQIEVLVEAYEQGYYKIPRSIKTWQLAQKFNVSRTATEKSLRKAENTIIASIIPYLLFHQRSHSPFGMKQKKIKLEM